LGKGFSLKIYDEHVNLSKLTGTNKEFIDQKIPHLAALMLSDIEELVEGSEVVVVSYNDDKFHRALAGVVHAQIVDLARLPQSFLELPNYYGINW
jgi:GDP-mannose 6-dehydrogenase